MSNVTLRIGGRAYTMACADGEEAHVAGLGALIDEKLQTMGNAAQSEARQLLFAALLLADELHDARARLATSASSATSSPATPSPAMPAAPGLQADLLESIATRLETCAAALEA